MSCAGPSVRRVKTDPEVNLARTLMKSQVIDAHTIFLREVILPQQYFSKPPAYMRGVHGWQRTTLQAAKLVSFEFPESNLTISSYLHPTTSFWSPKRSGIRRAMANPAPSQARCSHNLSSCESHFDSLSGNALVGGARAGAYYGPTRHPAL